MSEIYDVTGDYKGFKEKPYSDNNRFKGYRVHLYSNKQGKYGFVERGKDCQSTSKGYELQLRFTFEHAIDLLKQDVIRDYNRYDFTGDYIHGYFLGLGDGIMKLSPEPQPQLTIPKSIADELDFIYDNHFDSNDDISWVIANIDFLPTDEDYYNFDGWINLSVDNHNLALAYLAGKALGVELVKVVEG